MSIENRILKAVSNNKLSMYKTGERNWCNYFIRVTPLYWMINLKDGYKIEVYQNKYGEHLATVVL